MIVIFGPYGFNLQAFPQDSLPRHNFAVSENGRQHALGEGRLIVTALKIASPTSELSPARQALRAAIGDLTRVAP